MIIDQLPLLSGDVVATDEIPVERGTTTYKTTPDKFLAAMTKDAVPTQGSENAVESGGVYDALQTKQNALTFDSAPTQGSSNPVTSGGVYTAIENATPEGFVSYAEAQTLTTAQQQQARDNIGAASEWVLLWQNASPSSNFAAQNVSVNYSGYRALKIFYNLTSSNNRQLSAEIVSLDTGGVLMRLTSDATSVYISSRSFNLSGGTTISFADCYGAQLSSDGGRTFSVQNNTVIPYAIYGIK